jgi:hypothetical protein
MADIHGAKGPITIAAFVFASLRNWRVFFRSFSQHAVRAGIYSALNEDGEAMQIQTRERMLKIARFVAIAAGIVVLTEGYIRARDFVVQVGRSAHEIAVLQHEIETLRIELDVAPRPAAASALIGAQAQQPVSFPLPAPMGALALTLPAEAPRKARQSASRTGSKAGTGDEPSDDGPVVLLSDPKATQKVVQAKENEISVSLLVEKK